MKQINNFITEKLCINKDTKLDNYKYHPKDKNELEKIIQDIIIEQGDKPDLNDIDTSNITDMSNLFEYNPFDGDISRWDVSKVENMKDMFYHSYFTGKNGDISEWDVSNVTNMHCMFYESKFNGDISKWNVKKVKNMGYMFHNSSLEKNPPKWYKE